MPHIAQRRPDIEALLAEGYRVREEARRSDTQQPTALFARAAAAPDSKEQTDAEARRLVYDVVCDKRRLLGLDQAAWEAVSTSLGVYFASARHHPECNRLPPGDAAAAAGVALTACQVHSKRRGDVFSDPKTGRLYAATGSVFVCTQRGQPHHCVPLKCRWVQENPEAPGTLTCPISGFDMGAGIDDSGMFYRAATDSRASDARDLATRTADEARYGRSDQRRRRPSRPAAADSSAETRRFQLQHARHQATEHAPAHREDVTALVRLVVVHTALREAMRREFRAMEERQEAELLEWCARNERPPDLVACASIVAQHVLGGLPSVMAVCAHNEQRLARDDELRYLENCMFALFHSIRRVSTPKGGVAAGGVPLLHKDPNLKRLSLMLFYLLLHGLVGTRTYDPVTGRVRTWLRPEIPADHQLYEAVPLDDDGGLAADDDDSDDLDGMHRARRESFVFVPAHPGLRSYLPDMDVLAKVRVGGLLDETASPMRKRRRVSWYFTRMLCEPDPAQFCLGAAIEPLRPELFL